MIESVRGIVLRKKKDREADVVVSVLTEDARLIRARFHGLLQSKTRSNLLAEPGSYVELVLHSKDGRASVKEGHLIERHDAWKSGYRPLALLSSVLEFAEGVANACEGETLFRLLRGALEEGESNPRVFDETGQVMFFAALRLRGLAAAGLAGDFAYCASCGTRLGSTAHWNVPELSFTCANCAADSDAASARAANTMARMVTEPFQALLNTRANDAGYLEHLRNIDHFLSICIRHALPFPSPAADALSGGGV